MTIFARVFDMCRDTHMVETTCACFLRSGCCIPKGSPPRAECDDEWAPICRVIGRLHTEIRAGALVPDYTLTMLNPRRPGIPVVRWVMYKVVEFTDLPLSKFSRSGALPSSEGHVWLDMGSSYDHRMVSDLRATWDYCRSKGLVGDLRADWYQQCVDDRVSTRLVVFVPRTEWPRMQAWQLFMRSQESGAADHGDVAQEVVALVSRWSPDKCVAVLTLAALTCLLMRRASMFKRHTDLHARLRRTCLTPGSLFMLWRLDLNSDLFDTDALSGTRHRLLIVLRQSNMKAETVMCQCAVALMPLWSGAKFGPAPRCRRLAVDQETRMARLFTKLSCDPEFSISFALLSNPVHYPPSRTSDLAAVVMMCALQPDEVIADPISWLQRARSDRCCLCRLAVAAESRAIREPS
jgi:hypothetical protein